MNRGAAKGWRFRGCWRQWLATALLLVAFAPLDLQAGVPSMPAGRMIHSGSAMAAALDQSCDTSHAAAGCVRPISGDQDGSSASGPGPQDDCCHQFCTIMTAVLPKEALADPPPAERSISASRRIASGGCPEGFCGRHVHSPLREGAHGLKALRPSVVSTDRPEHRFRTSTITLGLRGRCMTTLSPRHGMNT